MSGRYRIGRCLGTGSQGVVHEALDLERDVRVALKMLKRPESDALRRLKLEFRALADLSHPNLVALHELVATDDDCFVAMDLVDGVPFLEWVRPDLSSVRPAAVAATFEFGGTPEGAPRATEAPASPPSDLLRLRDAFRQLAEGVAELHRHGRLHRDLKPSNVLVERGGRVVLLDFGLVALVGRADAGTVAGTAAYMAPEQAAGGAVGPASDWYAVGVMLFEALTGTRPFQGSGAQILSDKQRFEAPDPEERCPGLPADLADLARRLLRRDPAERPVAAEVLAAFGATGDATPTGSVLVGREDELARLGLAWAAALERRRPVVATVRGRSGIGKTALVERFVAGLGAPVLSGRCYERESVPYKALDTLVDALAAQLRGPRIPAQAASDEGVRTTVVPLEAPADLDPADVEAAAALFPVLRGRRSPPDEALADPAERRARGFVGLERLLAACAPVCLVVDDAHWGDLDSAAFFVDLLRVEAPLLLLLTWRTEEQDGSVFLTTLLRAAEGVAAIDLDQLSPESCRALARRLLPDAGEDTISSIARAAGGHPLFVHELARSGAPRSPQVDLDDAIRARVATLPDAARELLEAAAIAGRPVEARTIGRALARSDVVPEVTLLRAGRLLRTSGARVEPFHDRVREAVAASLAAERVVALHRALADAISTHADPDPEALAVHWMGAGEPQRALPCAVRAAERALAQLAFDHAAELFRLALGCDPADRDALSIRLGHALAAAGRPAEAADVWLAVPELPVTVRCLAAEQLLAAGHVARGLETVEATARQAGVEVPAGQGWMLADLLARRAVTWLRGIRWTRADQVPDDVARRLAACWAAIDGIAYVDPLRMAAYQARYLPMALASGDPRSIARALITEAGSVAFEGGNAAWARAQRLLDEAARAVAASDDGDLPGLHRYGVAMLAYHQHRFDEAYPIAVECERLFLERSERSAWLVARARMLQCWCHLWRGRLRQIALLVPKMVRDAEERGNLYVATSATTDIGYVLGLVKDEPEAVLAQLDERERRWSVSAAVPGFHLQHLNLGMARVQLHAYQGDAERAFATADGLWAQWRRSVLARGLMFRGLVPQLRARAALALAEQAPARRRELVAVARRSIAQVRALELPNASATIAGFEARMLELDGQLEPAVVRFREAVAGAAATGIPAQANAYRRHLGLLLGGDEGAELVARADAWMREQGVARPGRFAAATLMTSRGRD